MKIEPINLKAPEVKQPFDSPSTLLRAETRKKAEDSTSGYYVTTLQSLATAKQAIDLEPALNELKTEKEKKSLLGRAKEWLWSLFGFGKKEPAVSVEETENENDSPTSSSHIEHTPRLPHPEATSDKKLSKAILELNKELVTRLKDMAEFEEEMRQATSKKLDKLIFFQLVESSMRQRQLKEDGSVLNYENILTTQKKNKDLQSKYFNLIDEINSRTKTNKALHWVNVGATVGIVTTIAATFATAGLGSVLLAGIPYMTLAKGGTTLAEGILKYQNDLKTGELFIVGKESKTNSGKINEHLSDLQISDEEIGQLLKTIRHHLENQSRAERACFGRTG